jgi:putative FmdB family regulatory protein
MPIYQYVCRNCSHRFDRLVMGQARPDCPVCGSPDLERLLSVFAVGPGASRGSTEAPTGGACGTCGDPRGPGACALP